MLPAAARVSRLLRTHNPSLSNATRLYRHPPTRLTGHPPKHLPPTPPPPMPPSQPSLTPVVTAIGVVSGAFGAMCGVGGAIFAIPALVHFAALSQRRAAANALIAVTGIAATGAVLLSTSPDATVDVSTAALLATGATLFTPLGAATSRRINTLLLRRSLGSFMLILAPMMPLRSYLEQRASDHSALDAQLTPTKDLRVTFAAVGSIVGFASGVLGISGGSLFTPAIAFLCPEHSFKQVLATSFAAMIIPSAVNAASYARMGYVAPALLPPLVFGAVTGAAIGSAAALAVPDQVLQWTFAAVFTVMGCRVIRAPIARVKNVANAPHASTTTRITSRVTP